MKYIITESQFKLLNEQTPLGLRRRLSYTNLEKFIFNAELDFPTLCDDFGDEFEYADNVISRAVDDFLSEDENFMNSLGNTYDEVFDYVHEIVKDWFGDYLIEIYQSTCEDYIDD